MLYSVFGVNHTAYNPGKSNGPIYEMNWLPLELSCSCVHLDFLSSSPLLQLEFVCLSVEIAILGVFLSFRRCEQTITSFHSVLNPRSFHFGIRFIWIGSRPRGNLLPADKKRSKPLGTEQTRHPKHDGAKVSAKKQRRMFTTAPATPLWPF